MKSSRLDNDNLRHAAYHGNVKKMAELLDCGGDPDMRSQVIPLPRKKKIDSYLNVMDLAAIGKKPLETLKVLFDKLPRKTLEKLHVCSFKEPRAKEASMHTTVHIGTKQLYFTIYYISDRTIFLMQR